MTSRTTKPLIRSIIHDLDNLEDKAITLQAIHELICMLKHDIESLYQIQSLLEESEALEQRHKQYIERIKELEHQTKERE